MPVSTRWAPLYGRLRSSIINLVVSSTPSGQTNVPSNICCAASEVPVSPMIESRGSCRKGDLWESLYRASIDFIIAGSTVSLVSYVVGGEFSSVGGSSTLEIAPQRGTFFRRFKVLLSSRARSFCISLSAALRFSSGSLGSSRFELRKSYRKTEESGLYFCNSPELLRNYHTLVPE